MKRKKFIRTIAYVMVLLMLAMCLAGCGSDSDNGAESSQPPGTVISQTDTDLTIVDQAGREVTVKKDPESIALCYRVVVRFLLNLGQGDKIKGIGKNEEFFERVQPSMMDAADVGKGVADIEALAELKPDLFFHKANDIETLEAVEEIGIPSVGIEVETSEDIAVALDIMGKVCGAEDKAAELIDYYNSKISELEKLSEKISDKDRKTAIVMGSSIGKVADGTMIQGEMLRMAGAVNCAADIEATELWPTAGTEQIFSWNPEYIFITNSESTVYDEEDILKDKAWSEMKAVKKKNVFTMPAELDSWEFPGVVSAIGVEYIMHVMYPELVPDKMLEEDVQEFYKLAYDKEFEREELGY